MDITANTYLSIWYSGAGGKNFTKAGVPTPNDLDGYVATDFKFELIDDMPARAFARRSLKLGLQAVATRSVSVDPPAGSVAS